MFTIPTQQVILKPVGEVFRITSPQNNSTVSGVIKVTANRNVGQWAILKDRDILSGNNGNSSSSVLFDTTLLGNGKYTLWLFDSSTVAESRQTITINNKGTLPGIILSNAKINGRSVSFNLVVRNNVDVSNQRVLFRSLPDTGDQYFQFQDVCIIFSEVSNLKTFKCNFTASSNSSSFDFILENVDGTPSYRFWNVRNNASRVLGQ